MASKDVLASMSQILGCSKNFCLIVKSNNWCGFGGNLAEIICKCTLRPSSSHSAPRSVCRLVPARKYGEGFYSDRTDLSGPPREISIGVRNHI